MGWAERRNAEMASVTRVVKYNIEERRLFEMSYEALAIFRPGPGRSERRRLLEGLMDKLDSGSVAREQERGANPDLVLRTLDGPAAYELAEAERDLLVEAIDGIDWPGFASALARQARELLTNAERVEHTEAK
jgi:hypothetical protein